MDFNYVVEQFPDVRRNGDTARAHCVICDSRGRSVSIQQLAERINVKCFAGCDTGEILASIGLSFRDLYPNSTPAKRKQAVRAKNRYEIEGALYHELLILLRVIGDRRADRINKNDMDFVAGRPEFSPMPEEHWDRETLAATRVCNGLKGLYGCR